MEGRRRLRDRLAGPAAELLPHMLGHKPLPRDDIERLGEFLCLGIHQLGREASLSPFFHNLF
jgi:hypothetical protein